MRVKRENVQRSLYLSDDLTDSDRVSADKLPVDALPASVHKHHILRGDDDVLGANIRAEVLEENGYSVVVFHSPLEATCCDLSTFSLAILDFEMPGLNGRELLLRIRAMGARFPIVLLTGRLEGLSRADCVSFSRCIDKSMPVRFLLDTISEFLGPSQDADYGW